MKLFRTLVLIFAIIFGGSHVFANVDSHPTWFKAFPAFRIVGNLYYVGSQDLASYLIVTPQGNILINTSYEANLPLIKDSIRRLGFKFKDIKIVLISQAHADHAAASAKLVSETHAKYMVMAEDVSSIESGGKTDFLFGDDPEQQYQPVKVDRILNDGDEVKLGGSVLVAHLTAGHTKGCTTWTMAVRDHDKLYHVVIVGGVSMNPGTQLINNSRYHSIDKDYVHMWKVLKSLPCDIYLGAHGVYFNLTDKYQLMNVTHDPFVDPTGYQSFIKKSEHDFQLELKKQRLNSKFKK